MASIIENRSTQITLIIGHRLPLHYKKLYDVFLFIYRNIFYYFSFEDVDDKKRAGEENVWKQTFLQQLPSSFCNKLSVVDCWWLFAPSSSQNCFILQSSWSFLNKLKFGLHDDLSQSELDMLVCFGSMDPALLTIKLFGTEQTSWFYQLWQVVLIVKL